MEKAFEFRITPLDAGAVQGQIGRALEKRTEIISRKKYPFLWNVTDRMTGTGKDGEQKGENDKERDTLPGVINWAFGVVLLVPGLMSPGKLPAVAAAGAVGLATGSMRLWKTKRKLLAYLSLAAGILLFAIAFVNPEGAKPFLLGGLAELAVGIAARSEGKFRTTGTFDRAAMRLIQGRAAAGDTSSLRVAFSDSGMSVIREGEPENGEEGAASGQEIPYESFEYTAETEDLFLMVYDKKVMVLKKEDLLEKDITEFRQFFTEKAGAPTAV